MGNFGAHIWTIIVTVITLILALLIWFFGFGNLRNSLASDNLQDAVSTSAYLAQDKSARTERGTFVINKDKFIQNLNKTKIKKFGNASLGDGNNSSGYDVYYLPDNAKSDGSHNDYNASHGDSVKMVNHTEPKINEHNTRDNSTHNGHGYEAIRGIRVVIHYDNRPDLIKKYEKNKTSKASKDYKDFTATDIIQTNGKNASNDTPNDLTR